MEGFSFAFVLRDRKLHTGTSFVFNLIWTDVLYIHFMLAEICT